MRNATTRIKLKIQLAFIVFTAGAALISGAFYFYLQRIGGYQQARSDVDQLQILTLELRKHESDFIQYDSHSEAFMSSGTCQSLENHRATYQRLEATIEGLRNNTAIQRLDLESDLAAIDKARRHYSYAFGALADELKMRGFKDFGLEGKMRTAVHDLENNSHDLDKASLLTLRRHEKDFFLRKDLTYVKRLRLAVEELNNRPELSPATLAALRQYKRSFNQIVSIEEELGLTVNLGLRGSLRRTIAEIEPPVASMHNQLSTHIDNVVAWSRLVVGIALALLLLGSIGYGIWFSYAISRPIVLLDRVTRSVVMGLRNQERFLDRIESRDELGNLARNFKLMLLKLKASIHEGKEQNQRLADAAAEESVRKWRNEGLAQFGEILRTDHATLADKCNRLLATLINYLGASQGAFYLTDTNEAAEPVLQMVACYAYDRKKHERVTIGYGQGLVGSAWRDRDPVYITDVPQDFARIRTGLGGARPGCILIMPIQTDKSVEGMLELLSYQALAEHEIDFVKRLAGHIAVTLSSLRLSDTTRRLLSDSEALASSLREKEQLMEEEIALHRAHASQLEARFANLEQENGAYETLMEKLFAGCILTDEKFAIRRTNRFVQQTTLFGEAELIGQPIQNLFEGNRFVATANQLRHHLLNRHLTVPIVVSLKDRLERGHDVELSVGTLRLDGVTLYAFLFNTCNPERREMGLPSRVTDNTWRANTATGYQRIREQKFKQILEGKRQSTSVGVY